ncbi:hypothetical protein T03_12484, partial [Trichinella britovi]
MLKCETEFQIILKKSHDPYLRFQNTQWFLQQEVDLFHFRILCQRND